MQNLLEKQTQLIKEFSEIKTWDDRYKKMIDMGKKLPEMPMEFKTEKNLIKGCQSQVWLHARLTTDGRVELFGDSDALIVKGIVAVLLAIYNQSLPEEIMQHQPDFLRDIGFEANLSPSRTNGLHSMLKQIKMYATAFYFLNKK